MGREEVSQIIRGEDDFLCQVCDARLIHESDDELEEKLEIWKTLNFQNEVGKIELLVCPQCANMGVAAILACYRNRVRGGHDLNFH